MVEIARWRNILDKAEIERCFQRMRPHNIGLVPDNYEEFACGALRYSEQHLLPVSYRTQQQVPTGDTAAGTIRCAISEQWCAIIEQTFWPGRSAAPPAPISRAGPANDRSRCHCSDGSGAGAAAGQGVGRPLAGAGRTATQPAQLCGAPRKKEGGCDGGGVALIVATRSTRPSGADAPRPVLGARRHSPLEGRKR